MTGRRGRGSGCFKVGCLGCVALIVVPAVLIVLIGMARLIGESRAPDPITSKTEQVLPPPPVEQPSPEATPSQGPTWDDAAAPPRLASAAPPGRVVLDVGMTELRIEPAPPGSPLQLLADYDRNAFDLEESFEVQPSGGWTYRLSFGIQGGLMGALVAGGRSGNELRLSIPAGHPLRLEGRIGPGQSRIDLGGLWLTDVDLTIAAGSHRVVFSEPLHRPLGILEVDSSYGETRILKIGHASPAQARFDHKAGELVVDLEGAWQNDATLDVHFSFGECRVLLPEAAAVELDDVSLLFGEKSFRGLPEREDLPADAPVLSLSVSGTGGGLTIR